MSAFNESDANAQSMLFIAGFQLGIPLALCKTKNGGGWPTIREALTKKFCSLEKDYYVIEEVFDEFPDADILAKVEPETNMPLDWPLRIEYIHFLKNFPVKTFCQNEKNNFSHESLTLKSEIWICPTGIVLIIGRISSPCKDVSHFNELSDIIEDHYAELSYIYIQVASCILSCIKENKIKKVSHIHNDIKLLEKFIDQNEIINLNNEFIYSETNKKFLESIIDDIYYIEFIPNLKNKNRIEYTDATIYNNIYTSIYIVISYYSFLNLRWLTKHLTHQTKILQESMSNPSRSTGKNIINIQEMKSFRVFCLRLLNEIRPMSIRLKREYMEAMESFWEGSRMEKDVDLINSQLATIENIFEWIDATKKQIRDFKLTLGAIVLTIISISAVVAQLISTIDFNSEIDKNLRIILISGGSSFVALIILLIYIIPGYTKK